MKRLFAMLLVVVMVLSFAACKKAPNVGSQDSGLAASKGDLSKLKTEADFMAAEEEIRYAVGLLLDRNYIVNNVSQSGEKPANSFVADGMADKDGGNFALNANGGKGYFSVAEDSYAANKKEALTILKKYYDFDGTKFTNFPKLTYIYNTNDNHKKIGEYIQSALKEVGIDVVLQNQEWATFLDTRKQGNYSVARNGWVADYTDPMCFLDMWTSNSGNNDIQYGKGAHADKKIYNLDLTGFGIDIKVENGTWAETYDVLIDQAKKCTDANKRYELMHLAEDILMATGCITPIYFYTDPYMLHSSVEGFFSSALGYKYFYKTTVNGKGDSLPVCLGSEPDSLDPALNSAVDGATMLVQLFSGLAKWDMVDGKMQIVADCAKELVEGVVNEDGTVTYTYTLKDGLKWSNGKALTAHDFEFAWKRAASAELGADYGYMFEVVKGYGTANKDDLAVKALNDKTLEVTLFNAVTYWNELLAFPTYFPVYKDAVKNESWATDPSTYVCNGPYKMTAWAHDSVITLTKNDKYHDASIVTMNEIKCYLSDDDNNMMTNFTTDAWLLIDSVPTAEIPNLKNDPQFVIAGQIGTYYVCWNINEQLLPRK